MAIVGLTVNVMGLVGKQVKIAAVELPDLNRPQRSIVGALGAALVVFGLLDGQLPAWPSASPPDATVAAQSGGETPINNLAPYECFAEVAEANRIEIAIETARQTNIRFGTGQPREATYALQFMSAGNFVGSVKLKSLASNVGYDILSVVDSVCNPITTYENTSRPDQPQNAPYAYDTLYYPFGEMVIAMEIFYKDNGLLELHAQPVAP